jgi:hypothetical protein
VIRRGVYGLLCLAIQAGALFALGSSDCAFPAETLSCRVISGAGAFAYGTLFLSPIILVLSVFAILRGLLQRWGQSD